jgi:hypothetical protein
MHSACTIHFIILDCIFVMAYCEQCSLWSASLYNGSWGSSVSVATRLWAGQLRSHGSVSGRGKRFFSFLQWPVISLRTTDSPQLPISPKVHFNLILWCRSPKQSIPTREDIYYFLTGVKSKWPFCFQGETAVSNSWPLIYPTSTQSNSLCYGDCSGNWSPILWQRLQA